MTANRCLQTDAWASKVINNALVSRGNVLVVIAMLQDRVHDGMYGNLSRQPVETQGTDVSILMSKP